MAFQTFESLAHLLRGDMRLHGALGGAHAGIPGQWHVHLNDHGHRGRHAAGHRAAQGGEAGRGGARHRQQRRKRDCKHHRLMIERDCETKLILVWVLTLVLAHHTEPHFTSQTTLHMQHNMMVNVLFDLHITHLYAISSAFYHVCPTEAR